MHTVYLSKVLTPVSGVLPKFKELYQSENSAIFVIQNSLCDHSAIYVTTVLLHGSYNIDY